jgi:hypothetical protein
MTWNHEGKLQPERSINEESRNEECTTDDDGRIAPQGRRGGRAAARRGPEFVAGRRRR